MRGAVPLALLLLGGCSPNPRNEIGVIADAALADAAHGSPGQVTCVERIVTPWQAAAAAARYDPPPPPGMGDLYAVGVFRGGGGLRGTTAGGVPVGGGGGCVRLAGPLVSGDCAMVEVRHGATALNEWLRQADGRWRVVMTTSGEYRR